ncbi:hypothetical protein HOV93_08190 [Planctomycetes bacterium FF15]|uniref:Uncharacterized protein n=1 Tax=Bremerella alba TaxID=980252 RepID=A0A7V8V2E5_9BACT|nr:hypothetical protein [Bremerella alba]
MKWDFAVVAVIIDVLQLVVGIASLIVAIIL